MGSAKLLVLNAEGQVGFGVVRLDCSGKFLHFARDNHGDVDGVDGFGSVDDQIEHFSTSDFV